MKVLNLIIKQKYFDAIMQGRKVQEFREVRPTTIKKLLQLDENGYEVEDEYGNAQPIKYDAIRFYVGYNPDRDSALVEVKDAYCEMFTRDVIDEHGNVVMDENGQPQQELIEYEYNGELWYAEQVVFNLGKILESDIKPKTRKG
ncbi:MAG: ASCH domain-containing protein [Prevotella sp.]|nr:ASCH domain-containing protein [Candidatus Prevotella equi]